MQKMDLQNSAIGARVPLESFSARGGFRKQFEILLTQF